MPRLSSFFVLVLITASILCFLCQLYLLSDVDAAMRPDDDSSHEIVLEFLSPSAEQSLEIIESFSENNNSQVFAPLGNFNNATSVNVSVLMPGDLSNSTIYRCGYDVVTLIFAHVYPEIKDKILKATHLITLEMAQLASENDVLIVGGEGDCKNRKAPMPIDWLEDNFKGTIFIVNGESRVDRHKWRDLEDISTIPKNQYHLGHIADGCQSRRLHFLAQEFVRKRHLWDFFMKEEDKQKSTRERFLIYTNGHCVDFRDNAFDAIARATPTLKLEVGGKCNGNMKNLPNVVKSDLPFGKLNQYSQNWKMMRNYRFCLVMENSYVEGYITEKIMNAFAGGCIPIYYGTTEIFDIFNPKSFIYYDIKNPQDALDEISRLENNSSAYDEVMAEPILLEGNETIQKYFSLSDEMIPNARLKKRLREMPYTRCRRKQIPSSS